MKKFLYAVTAALLLACTAIPSNRQYVDWLYEYMPLPDSLSHDREWWEANVDKTLEVRQKMGWNIPEREFRHFVLPLRVNNEILDDFRTEYADTLCRRVKGMSLYDAALEINHWCHEQATYKPSDARTSSPMATVRNGTGRCGEESVLAVAALRAAGIPARQVYTPRWAHTDDNHAWVEVWVDGKWHFMGACEPEPRLDRAWFSAPVSRAMLLHTKVYGAYDGPEDVILRTPCYTEINVIRGYVPARRTVVTVKDGAGNPVSGAHVEFKIYNYAEFFTVAVYETGADGKVALDMGLGDALVWASKGDRFGFVRASSETAEVVLDHVLGETFTADIDLFPPEEHPIPAEVTEEEQKRNAERLAMEDSIRSSHPHGNPDVEAFLAEEPERGGLLMSLLSAKDRGDVTKDVLQDAVGSTDSSDPFVLNPRISHEQLLPFRAAILASGLRDRLATPSEVVRWVKDSIRIVEDRNPQGLRIPPASVWKARMADRQGRDIFFVALCRSLGFPARIDPVTGKTQFREETLWTDVVFDAEETEAVPVTGKLRLHYSGNGIVRTPMYYRHFTLSRLGNGPARLQEFGTDADEIPLNSLDGGTEMETGYYLLTTGTRLSGGGVLTHLAFFNVSGDSIAEVPFVLRKPEEQLAVIGSMDPEHLFLKDGSEEPMSILSATGRGYFLLVLTGGKDEPTQHAIRGLEDAASDLNAWGKPVLVLGQARPDGLRNLISGSDPDGKVLEMLTRGCDRTSRDLPVVAVCDSFGRIVYCSQGYATTLSTDLRRVLSQL